MNKHRDRRTSHRDRFDSEHEAGNAEPKYFQRRSPAPPSSAQAAGASLALDAEAVWFNPSKGFGFVRLGDGSEAFLHVSKLESAGQSSLAEGTKLKVLVETSARGKPQVAQVLSIEGSNAGAISRPPRRAETQPSEQEEQLGTVKRYDPERGFGFIKLDKGGGDAFVHATTLSRSGLPPLEAGQKVYVSCVQGLKGLEARSVRLA